MNRKFLHISAVILSIFLGLSVNIEAQTPKSTKKNQPIAIKLEREKLGKIPTVSVNIGGKNYTFFFDSGAAVTSISPSIAKAIGCEPYGQLTGYDAGGGVHKMTRCDDVEMNVGGFSTKIDVTVSDPMIYFPPKTPQIDGIISLQTFEDQIITMDLIGNNLFIETDKSFKKRTADMKPLKSRLSRELSGYGVDIFLAVNSPKGKVWMLLDTGNTNKLLLAPHAQEQLGIVLDKSSDKTPKPVSLDLLGFGTIEAMGREREMIYDGMLNYDTILKMLLTIDLKNGNVWAKANPFNAN
jgi:hypothetical protein